MSASVHKRRSKTMRYREISENFIKTGEQVFSQRAYCQWAMNVPGPNQSRVNDKQRTTGGHGSGFWMVALISVYLLALSTCAHAQGQEYKSVAFAAALRVGQAQPIVRSMGLRRPVPAVGPTTQPSPAPAQDACWVAAIAGSWVGHKL